MISGKQKLVNRLEFEAKFGDDYFNYHDNFQLPNIEISIKFKLWIFQRF